MISFRNLEDAKVFDQKDFSSKNNNRILNIPDSQKRYLDEEEKIEP